MKPEEIQTLADHFLKIAKQARKTAATLVGYQNKPINRIKTLEAQRYELDKATATAIRNLDTYTHLLRARQDHASGSDSDNLQPDPVRPEHCP